MGVEVGLTNVGRDGLLREIADLHEKVRILERDNAQLTEVATLAQESATRAVVRARLLPFARAFVFDTDGAQLKVVEYEWGWEWRAPPSRSGVAPTLEEAVGALRALGFDVP